VEAASGKTFETPNPATGETLARVAEGDAEDINRAVRAARRAFEEGPWGRMTASDRGRIIWKIGDLILDHADELAQLESLDNGKPVAVARAADVPLAADLFHYMAGWATKIEGNTIITNTRPDMKIVREEIFGPVVVAAPFSSLDEIAAEANDSEYGLGAGIWTKDISKAHALAKKLRAGTVWINCYNVFDAALPFGGYKQSGWGREMGHEALEAYTEVKAVTTQL
jgi:acyl-CoA reductase-like NAD-dependent aldehyde dehydrogenase